MVACIFLVRPWRGGFARSGTTSGARIKPCVDAAAMSSRLMEHLGGGMVSPAISQTNARNAVGRTLRVTHDDRAPSHRQQRGRWARCNVRQRDCLSRHSARCAFTEHQGSADQSRRMKTPNLNQPATAGFGRAASAGCPCLLRRAWICLVLKRKEARVAAAASTLACHAWNTGDDELWEQMYPLQEKLWDAIYAKDNA